MLRKPALESVVVLVISVASVGMTVAALVVPVPEQGGLTGLDGVPAAAASAPASTAAVCPVAAPAGPKAEAPASMCPAASRLAAGGGSHDGAIGSGGSDGADSAGGGDRAHRADRRRASQPLQTPPSVALSPWRATTLSAAAPAAGGGAMLSATAAAAGRAATPASGKTAVPAPRMCALSLLRHHGGARAGARHAEPSHLVHQAGDTGAAGTTGGSADTAGPHDLAPASGAAASCSEGPQAEAARPAAAQAETTRAVDCCLALFL